MAQCDPTGTIIYLGKVEVQDPDTYFSIAHELRHIWQMRTDDDYYFADYKPVNLCSSIEQYNLQPTELDANAFSGLIVYEFFGLQPLFNKVPEIVKMRIFSEMEHLKNSDLMEQIHEILEDEEDD